MYFVLVTLVVALFGAGQSSFLPFGNNNRDYPRDRYPEHDRNGFDFNLDGGFGIPDPSAILGNLNLPFFGGGDSQSQYQSQTTNVNTGQPTDSQQPGITIVNPEPPRYPTTPIIIEHESGESSSYSSSLYSSSSSEEWYPQESYIDDYDSYGSESYETPNEIYNKNSEYFDYSPDDDSCGTDLNGDTNGPNSNLCDNVGGFESRRPEYIDNRNSRVFRFRPRNQRRYTDANINGNGD